MNDDPASRPSDAVSRLADADAGLPDAATAARVRAAATADPENAAVLDALAATRADLAALPPVPVPDDVAARWDAALATASRTPPSRESDIPVARVGHPGPASRTTRTLGSGGRARHRLLSAAAAVLAVAAAATGLLVRPATPPTLAVARVDLAAAVTSTVGVRDLGALADPRRRAACFAAVGLRPLPEGGVLGGRSVLLDGTPGTLLVLATGELGALRIVVVDPACGAAGRGTLLAETVAP